MSVPFRRILCPVDFGDASLAALDLATRLAADRSTLLVLLHVCPTILVPLTGRVTSEVEGEESARKKLNELAAKCLTGIQHKIVVPTGDAAPKIVEAARDLDADLVVMGTHGRHGIKRAVLGSVAERVIREATCPVLTTHR